MFFRASTKALSRTTTAGRTGLLARSIRTTTPALAEVCDTTRGSSECLKTLRRADMHYFLPAPCPCLRAQVSIADLHALGSEALIKQGYLTDDAASILDVLMWAELRGNGSGLAELTSGALAPPSRDGKPLGVEYETKLSARIDGDQRAGQLVMQRAVGVAVDKAKQHGVGLVGTRNAGSSTGALGYYLESIANAGLIGLVFGQSPPGVSSVPSASPLGVSVPSPSGPVVLDMATAAAAVLGGANPASGASEVGLGDTLAVFDRSYKGSHLSTMVELLAGPLVGAGGAAPAIGAATAPSRYASADYFGNLVLAFDPELLGDREGFLRDVEAVLRRESLWQGAAGAGYPGEAQTRVYTAALQQGGVRVDDAVLSRLRSMASAPATATGMGGSNDYRSAYGMATRLAHPKGKGKGDPYNASSPVLFQTATFELDKMNMSGEYDYTRSGNPTRHMLEEQMADLEGAARSFAFTSGMAALAVAMKLVPSGGHIVTGDDIYGGTSRLLQRIAPECGITVSNVDMCDTEAVRRAMQPNTKLVWMESPTNPRMQITDIRSIANIARSHGALSMVDNSIMAPVFQQPIALGCDISMTSATKFVGGHSDVTAGILSCATDELADRVYFLQNSEGGGLAPFDCWLCLRGLKTMALRMEKQQKNAMALAQWLQSHPAVEKLLYPGLPTDPSYQLHMSQASGGGCLLSFTTGNVALSKGLMEHSKLFKVTVSFGSTTSLLSLPCFMSHASIPPEIRAARGLPDDLVRISAGIEDEKDLIADLAQAMDKACEAAGIQLPRSASIPPARQQWQTR